MDIPPEVSRKARACSRRRTPAQARHISHIHCAHSASKLIIASDLAVGLPDDSPSVAWLLQKSAERPGHAAKRRTYTTKPSQFITSCCTNNRQAAIWTKLDCAAVEARLILASVSRKLPRQDVQSLHQSQMTAEVCS